METTSPSIFINDDEVEFRVIYVCSIKSKKMRKYTIDEAERLGIIQVDTGSIQIGGDIYSKSITINDNSAKLCLSTKRNTGQSGSS